MVGCSALVEQHAFAFRVFPAAMLTGLMPDTEYVYRWLCHHADEPSLPLAH